MADDKTPIIDTNDLTEDSSDMDILNSETESKPPVVPDKEGKEEDEDKDENEEELETEESSEDEEIEEEELPESKLRPSIKTITKEFPEAEKIFKKYPQLRDAYFREGKFSQIFPSIEDAEESAQKAESLDTFNDLLMGGSSKELLQAIGQDSPEALKKLATNFLPTLASLSDDLFYEATIPVVNTAIRNLYIAGQKNKDNNVMAAAKIMAHFLHGTYDIPSPTERTKDPELDKERQKLQEERKSIDTERYTEFDTSVNDRTRRLMTKTISDGLDPTNSLSDFTKSKIIEEVIDRVGEELAKDHQHMTSISKLWKMAQGERFSSKSADRIITAFLSRAKPLISEVRSKVKNEALGTSSRKNGDSRRSTTRDTSAGSRTSERSSGIPTDLKKVDKGFWRKHSDADILK